MGAAFSYNPFTNNLDKSGAGGGGGSITLVPDSGSALNGTAFNIQGFQAGSTRVIETINNSGNFQVEDRSWLSRYVVDPSTSAGTRGTFSTITDAINQAVFDGAILANGLVQTVWIRPGYYQEDVAIPDNAFLNIICQSAGGYVNTNTSDSVILGSVTFGATTITYWENVCFYTQAGADTITIPDVASISFKNCTIIEGSNSAVNVTGNSYPVSFDGCTFFGKVVASTPNDQSTSRGLVLNSRLVSQWQLSNYAAFRCINCDLIGFICNDHAVAETLNCQGTAASLPFISGTTDGQQVVLNTSLRTLGQSNLPSPIFDFPGTLFFSNLTFKPIDDTNHWPFPALFSAQTTVKLTPTMQGNVLKSIRVASNYAVQYHDQYIGVTDTTSARTITLNDLIMPDQIVIIKDESLNASVNPITVNVSGGGLIDGQASQQIAQNGASLTFIFDGTNYFIL